MWANQAAPRYLVAPSAPPAARDLQSPGPLLAEQCPCSLTPSAWPWQRRRREHRAPPLTPAYPPLQEWPDRRLRATAAGQPQSLGPVHATAQVSLVLGLVRARRRS